MEQIVIGKKLSSNTVYTTNEKLINVFEKDLTEYGLDKKDAYGAGENYKVAFLLKDLENVTLDFNGATLFLNGKIQPFIIDNCKNITIKNVNVKNDRSPFSEGEVVEIGEDYIIAKFSDRFPYRVENGSLIFYGKTWENKDINKKPMMFMQFFNAKTRQGIGLSLVSIGEGQDENKTPYKPFHLTAKQVGDCVKLEGFTGNDCSYVSYSGKFCPIYFDKGDRFVIAHEDRALSSVFLRDSENVYLTDFRIVNGQGMGILPFRVKNLYLEGLKLTYDSLSDGFVTNSADAIHAVACMGDFVIKDSVIEGMVDDGINVHSNFFAVESTEKNIIHAKTCGPDGTDFRIFKAKDEIAVHNQSTMETKEKYKVIDVKIIDTTHVDMIVDRDALGLNEGDAIENLSCQCDLKIINSKFGKGNTHMRIQTAGKIEFINSEFELPVWLTGDLSYWFESSAVSDMVVDNCKFKTKNSIFESMPEFIPTEKEPYYHKNITIKNCEFDNEYCLKLKFTDNITFINNKCSSNKPLYGTFTNCGEIKTDGCIDIRRETVKKDSVELN